MLESTALKLVGRALGFVYDFFVVCIVTLSLGAD
jgi:hypothetical protein